jgi:hypothetical protein
MALEGNIGHKPKPLEMWANAIKMPMNSGLFWSIPAIGSIFNGAETNGLREGGVQLPVNWGQDCGGWEDDAGDKPSLRKRQNELSEKTLLG